MKKEIQEYAEKLIREYGDAAYQKKRKRLSAMLTGCVMAAWNAS